MNRLLTSVTTTRKGRLSLFGFLYFVQGAMLAYVLVFNNLYLRAFGASAAQLSLLNGLLVIPFVLKIGFGILSDKVRIGDRFPIPLLGSGHRIPYMKLGLLLIAGGGLLAMFIPPVEMYGLFLFTALLIAFGLSLFDTVTDGLAIDVTPAGEQQLTQGAMVIGRALGLVMLAALYGRVIQSFGWLVVFGAIIGFAMIPLLLLRSAHEPGQRSMAQTFSWQALTSLWRPEIGRFSLYAVLYAIPVYGTNAIVTLFANEGLGGTLVQIGDVAALAGLGMVFGGVLAVMVSRRLGIWPQAFWSSAAVSGVLLLVALVADLSNLRLITFLWGICLSAADYVFVTLSMAKSDRRIGAGQFAIFMAISNVGTGIGQATATGLIDTVSFRWIFAGMALVNFAIFPLLLTMRADDHQPMALQEQVAA